MATSPSKPVKRTSVSRTKSSSGLPSTSSSTSSSASSSSSPSLPSQAPVASAPLVEVDYGQVAIFQRALDQAIALKAGLTPTKSPDSIAPYSSIDLTKLLEGLSDEGVLSDDFQKQIGVQYQALARKFRSMGSALKQGNGPALDFMLAIQYYEALNSRSPYQAKESFKDMLQQLTFFSLAEGNVDTLKVLYKYAPLVELDMPALFRDRQPLKASPGEEPRYVSAPFMAVERGNFATLEWLLQEKKIDFAEFRGGQDETLFMAAVLSRQFDVANHLLATVADPTTMLNETVPLFNQTAMHLAAQTGNLEALAYLAHHGADPTIQSASNNLASEFLPESEEYQEDFNSLEDYRESFTTGNHFDIPEGWYASNQDKDGNVVLPVWLGGSPITDDKADETEEANNPSSADPEASSSPRPSF